MATQVKANPNDPRVKRTRQLLKQALSDLRLEKSFHDITVQDIAERATLNRVTFYAHFEDKYDLIGTWMRDGFMERLETALPVTSPLCAGNLRSLCRVVLETLREMQTHCRPLRGRYGPLFESAVQEALYAFILDWLCHWSIEEPLPDVSIESLGAALSWTIFGAAIDWGRGGEGRSLDGFVDEIVAVLLLGASSVFPNHE
ncbi:MAG: TetR/AcrR family transcriptional regulator [Chloroflexota bacterium]